MSNQTKAAGGLSDPGRIKEVLSRHGFHFSKALGQNFLINPTVCPRMAQACGAGDCKGVIEVGPGIGVLTWELSQVAEKVCAIELDSRLFPVLEELQVGFVAFSPLANGFLTARYRDTSQFEQSPADYRTTMPQFSKEGVEQNHELLALIENTAKEKNATPAQISLAWMLAKRPYIVPIPGSRKESRIRENLGTAEVILTAEEVDQLGKAEHMTMSQVFGGHRAS